LTDKVKSKKSKSRRRKRVLPLPFGSIIELANQGREDELIFQSSLVEQRAEGILSILWLEDFNTLLPLINRLRRQNEGHERPTGVY